MRKSFRAASSAAAALAAVVALAAPASAWAASAAAADHDEKKVRVHKIRVQCDGEDCEHDGGHRAIFVGENGEVHELDELMRDRLHWVEGGEHGLHVLGGSGTFLGVQLTDLTDELRTHFGAPAGQGVLVAKVVDGSPAAIAGVEVGDLITAVDGETVASGAALGRLIRARDEGETVALEVYRDGRVETVSPTLAKREARRMQLGDAAGGMLHRMHKVMVRCEGEDGDKDCEVTMGDGEAFDIGEFDCGGAEECRVEVRCDGDECDCTANGDAVDCEELPGFAERHGG